MFSRATATQDPADFVRELKRQPGINICVMSGGDLASALFAGDAIDEVRLNIHPILLGSGIPLFRDAGTRIQLDLVGWRTIDGGCVLADYRVKKSR